MTSLYERTRQNGSEADWDATKGRKGYKCRFPIEYEREGEVFVRDCGRCRDCIAMRKRDISGRAAAEAYNSAEVVVFTLTYREGEEGAYQFVTLDRQKFMKRLRFKLWDEARAKVGAPHKMRGLSPEQVQYWRDRIAEVMPVVRYIGCGERGTKSTKRCHWHIVCFMSKPSGIQSTPVLRDGRRWSVDDPLWPHGLVTRDVFSQDMPIEKKMRSIRYCVKYIDKCYSADLDKRGANAEAKFFRSNASPLGFEYLTERAKRCARAGLPLPGIYDVPGVLGSRPDWKTEMRGFTVVSWPVYPLTTFAIKSRMREHYIEAYEAEWQRVRPHVPMPYSEWHGRFDPAAWRGKVGAGHFDRLMVDGRRLEARRVAAREAASAEVDSGPWVVSDPKGFPVALVDLLAAGQLRIETVVRGVPRAVVVVPDADLWEVEGAALEDLQRVASLVAAARLRDAAFLADASAKRDAILAFAKRGPNERPDHVDGLEPLTGLMRQLRMNGLGHARPGALPRKPIAAREP